MKNIKNNLNKLPLALNAPKLNSKRKPKVKNLSPAKKFRLKLRREKFQKQQQAKDEYFEHDNRDAARTAGDEQRRKAGRLYKKSRRAQMYIDAYLKSQHEQHLNRNGDTASQDETQDSSNGNEVSMKSIVLKTNIGLPAMTSRFKNAFGKEQAIHNGKILSAANSSYPTTNAGNISNVSCCCHCACSKRKKKARRKLSSPYFGDIHRTVSCAREAAEVTTKILNKTTTTTHHETLVKAGVGGIVNFKKFSLNPNKVLRHGQMAPVFEKKYNLQSRSGNVGCGLRDMRTVMRYVLKQFYVCAEGFESRNFVRKNVGRKLGNLKSCSCRDCVSLYLHNIAQ